MKSYWLLDMLLLILNQMEIVLEMVLYRRGVMLWTLGIRWFVDANRSSWSVDRWESDYDGSIKVMIGLCSNKAKVIQERCDGNGSAVHLFFGRLISETVEMVLRAAGKLDGDSGKDVELVSTDCNVCVVLQMVEYIKETKVGYKMIDVVGTECDGLDYRMLIHLNDKFIAAEGSIKMIEMPKECCFGFVTICYVSTMGDAPNFVQILFVSSCMCQKGRLQLLTLACKKLIDIDAWTMFSAMFWAAKSNGPMLDCKSTGLWDSLLVYDGIGFDGGPEGGGLLSDLMPSWHKLCLDCCSII